MKYRHYVEDSEGFIETEDGERVRKLETALRVLKGEYWECVDDAQMGNLDDSYTAGYRDGIAYAISRLDAASEADESSSHLED